MDDNLFANLPVSLPEELCQTLLETEALRIERIVSTGQHSPPGFWYDQPDAEWVVLLRGEAILRLGESSRTLRVGDFVHIPAHARHRVEWTSDSEPTVWLAIHYREPT